MDAFRTTTRWHFTTLLLAVLMQNADLFVRTKHRKLTKDRHAKTSSPTTGVSVRRKSRRRFPQIRRQGKRSCRLFTISAIFGGTRTVWAIAQRHARRPPRRVKAMARVKVHHTRRRRVKAMARTKVNHTHRRL